ncbi:septin-14-like [Dasypus novemcinctus]|uniref:septin-14-like n=1 Tax=Dasypus novemcinctus TaxID=9361 RepID=UPI0039C964A5
MHSANNDRATAVKERLLPFAVVGSMDEVKVGKSMFRGCQYPWGVLQVENENHHDFVKLRDILLCTNMGDMKEQTHTRHYERYRCYELHTMGFTDVGPDNHPVSFQEIYEVKRQEFYDQCQREEEELKQVYAASKGKSKGKRNCI